MSARITSSRCITPREWPRSEIHDSGAIFAMIGGDFAGPGSMLARSGL
jgi:hypothetical protein